MLQQLLLCQELLLQLLLLQCGERCLLSLLCIYLLAWYTVGCSQGATSSSSTAGCRQWMKCLRLHTAACVPARVCGWERGERR